MDSFAKRLLILTSIALITLTGCSQQKTGSALEPPGGTASTGTASASNSTSPSATPQAAEHYSGGSKAPEGEYRPADEFGPAQNVPKPVEPEGMNVETTEGMELFINYWNDLRNYANQTGDVSSIHELVDGSFTQEKEFYDALDSIYNSGGWVIGGKSTVHYDLSLLLSHGNGEYSIGCNIEVDDSVLWYGGEATYSDNSETRYRGVELHLKYSNGGWKISGAEQVGQ